MSWAEEYLPEFLQPGWVRHKEIYESLDEEELKDAQSKIPKLAPPRIKFCNPNDRPKDVEDALYRSGVKLRHARDLFAAHMSKQEVEFINKKLLFKLYCAHKTTQKHDWSQRWRSWVNSWWPRVNSWRGPDYRMKELMETQKIEQKMKLQNAIHAERHRLQIKASVDNGLIVQPTQASSGSLPAAGVQNTVEAQQAQAQAAAAVPQTADQTATTISGKAISSSKATASKVGNSLWGGIQGLLDRTHAGVDKVSTTVTGEPNMATSRSDPVTPESVRNIQQGIATNTVPVNAADQAAATGLGPVTANAANSGKEGVSPVADAGLPGSENVDPIGGVDTGLNGVNTGTKTGVDALANIAIPADSGRDTSLDIYINPLYRNISTSLNNVDLIEKYGFDSDYGNQISQLSRLPQYSTDNPVFYPQNPFGPYRPGWIPHDLYERAELTHDKDNIYYSGSGNKRILDPQAVDRKNHSINAKAGLRRILEAEEQFRNLIDKDRNMTREEFQNSMRKIELAQAAANAKSNYAKSGVGDHYLDTNEPIELEDSSIWDTFKTYFLGPVKDSAFQTGKAILTLNREGSENGLCPAKRTHNLSTAREGFWTYTFEKFFNFPFEILGIRGLTDDVWDDIHDVRMGVEFLAQQGRSKYGGSDVTNILSSVAHDLRWFDPEPNIHPIMTGIAR